jgi:hypothetical protein
MRIAEFVLHRRTTTPKEPIKNRGKQREREREGRTRDTVDRLRSGREQSVKFFFSFSIFFLLKKSVVTKRKVK